MGTKGREEGGPQGGAALGLRHHGALESRPPLSVHRGQELRVRHRILWSLCLGHTHPGKDGNEERERVGWERLGFGAGGVGWTVGRWRCAHRVLKTAGQRVLSRDRTGVGSWGGTGAARTGCWAARGAAPRSACLYLLPSVSRGMRLRVCPPPSLGRRPHAKFRLRGRRLALGAPCSLRRSSVLPARQRSLERGRRGSERGPWLVRPGGGMWARTGRLRLAPAGLEMKTQRGADRARAEGGASGRWSHPGPPAQQLSQAVGVGGGGSARQKRAGGDTKLGPGLRRRGGVRTG